MTAKQLKEQLAVIAEEAKALRDAGIVGRISVGDVSFEVGVEAISSTTTATEREDEGRGNALDDRDTYGGHIPRRRHGGGWAEDQSIEDDDD